MKQIVSQDEAKNGSDTANPVSLKVRLLACIAKSQDGNSIVAISEEIRDGRLMSIRDNLNRLIADGINSAAESGDIETLRDYLRYAENQLRNAVQALNSDFFTLA